MIRIKWPVAIGILFLVLIGWYLLYTREIVLSLQENTTRLSEIYSKVQEGLITMEPSDAEQALFELQTIVRESGVPLVLTGPEDAIIAAENLPFAANLNTPEGLAAVQAYVLDLDALHEPVGDPDVQLVHFGDTPEVIRLRYTPLLQAGGLLITVLIGFLAVRYQRRAESDKEWTSMARELAHQLGTPLSSLAGWLEVLKLPHLDRPGALKDAQIAVSIGEDLERLERISYRFELIGIEPELEGLSVRKVARDLEYYLVGRIPRLSIKSIDLVIDVPKDLPLIMGNEVLLMWALENVVNNALDALAGRGGKITIYAREIADKWVSIRIKDTGPGVASEIRDKIFQPGVTSKSGGWGVGLALSRRIIEVVHKGHIELLEGFEGTTFQIRLPAADA
jgi:signal transduction histidine kinase